MTAITKNNKAYLEIREGPFGVIVFEVCEGLVYIDGIELKPAQCRKVAEWLFRAAESEQRTPQREETARWYWTGARGCCAKAKSGGFCGQKATTTTDDGRTWCFYHDPKSPRRFGEAYPE